MDERQRLLLKRFLAETNLEKDLAQDILAGSDWRYDQAVASFKRMLRANDRRLSFTSPPPSAPLSSSSKEPVRATSPAKPKAGQRSPQRTAVSSEDLPDGISPLHRGISRANLKANKKGVMKLEPPVKIAEDVQARVDSRGYYFKLPNLHAQPPDLSRIIKNDLLDLETMKHLHKAGCLNWWSSSGTCGPLYTMETSGDGNCLLHAASLSIWGMHDRELNLRSALNRVLTDQNFTINLKKIQRRWKRQQIQVNRELGLEYTAQEWEDEWESVLKLSSDKPRHLRTGGDTGKNESGGSIQQGNETTYESLEEIHVFVLAHILLRPIIVIADKFLRDVHGEPLAPNTFGGVYLPLEAKPTECCRSPVVLAYDMSHFCPLLPMDSDKRSIPNVIPITDPDKNLLRVQFAVDPGLGWKFDNSKDITLELPPEENVALLQKYLDLVRVPTDPKESLRRVTKLSPADVSSPEYILCVPLSDRHHPEYESLIRTYIADARRKLARSKAAVNPHAQSVTVTDGPPQYATLPAPEKGSRRPQNGISSNATGPQSRTKGGSRPPPPLTYDPPDYESATLSYPAKQKTGPKFERSPPQRNDVYHNSRSNPAGNSKNPVKEGPTFSAATLPVRGSRAKVRQSDSASKNYLNNAPIPKDRKPLPISTNGPPPYNYAVGQNSGSPKAAPSRQKQSAAFDSRAISPNSLLKQPHSPGVSQVNKQADLFDFKTPEIPTRKCRTPDCKFFGRDDTQFYCTKCWLTKS